MVRLRALVMGCLLVVLVLAMLPPSTASSTVVVSIPKGTASANSAPGYSPSKITLVIGVNDTVMWENNDTVAHTVTPSSTPTPSSWQVGSGNMDPGQVYFFTFTVPGNYSYTCAYHSFMGGSIVVKSETPIPEFPVAALAAVLLLLMAAVVLVPRVKRAGSDPRL